MKEHQKTTFSSADKNVENTTTITVPLYDVLGVFQLYVDDYFSENAYYLANDWIEDRLSGLILEDSLDEIKDLFFAELWEQLRDDFKLYLNRLARYLVEEYASGRNPYEISQHNILGNKYYLLRRLLS